MQRAELAQRLQSMRQELGDDILKPTDTCSALMITASLGPDGKPAGDPHVFVQDPDRWVPAEQSLATIQSDAAIEQGAYKTDQ